MELKAKSFPKRDWRKAISRVPTSISTRVQGDALKSAVAAKRGWPARCVCYIIPHNSGPLRLWAKGLSVALSAKECRDNAARCETMALSLIGPANAEIRAT